MNEFMEMAQTARRGLEDQRERLTEKMEQLEDYAKLLDCMEELIGDHKKLRDKYDLLQQQMEEEKQRSADLEIKLAEMSKLSAGMARKADQDDFLKALRIYLNISKRKTIGKREAAKNVITDLKTTAKLEFPDDIMEMLEHLDDEQSEPKTVVNGDIVMEKYMESRR